MKNQKGITLIALVVTIVVLLILAAVSIAMLRGDNGIVSNAQNAKYASLEGEIVDKMNLAYNAVKTEIKVKEATQNDYTPDISDLAGIACKEITGEDTFTSGSKISQTSYIITVNDSDDPANFTIKYDDGVNFGTGAKYPQAIECTINLENGDVTYEAPNRPYQDSQSSSASGNNVAENNTAP